MQVHYLLTATQFRRRPLARFGSATLGPLTQIHGSPQSTRRYYIIAVLCRACSRSQDAAHYKGPVFSCVRRTSCGFGHPGHDTRAIVAEHRLLGAHFCPETLRLWIRRGGLAAGRRWGSAARGSVWLVARSPTQQSTFSCVSRATRSRNRAWHSPPTRRGKSFPDASLPRPPPGRMRFLRTDGLTPHCHRCGRESWDGTRGPDLWRVPEQLL